ncbi:MAG TPA: hypothetical protein VKK79_12280, partial [Candidatus Lokiarchaeia archaeon]|nr:hypothetical protein [Candidatus Lokiarchaeia archaeon]
DEGSAIEAIRDMHVHEVNGISVNQALKFALNLFSLEHQVSQGDILKTPDANRIYHQILDIIRNFFATEHAKKKLELYFPLSPDQLDVINERLDFGETALNFVQQSSVHPLWDEYLGLLGDLAPFKDDGTIPKIKSRVIVTDDPRVEASIKDAGLHKVLDVEVLEPEMLKDAMKMKAVFQRYAKEFDTVFVSLSKSALFPDGPNFFEIESKGPYALEDIVPEAIFQKYARNYAQIKASCTLLDILNAFPATSGRDQFLAGLPTRFLPLVKSALQVIDSNGNFKESVSKKLDRLRRVAEKASGLIAEAETLLNTQIRELVESSSMTLNGTQLLNLLRSNGMASIQEYLPDEIDLSIRDILDKGKLALFKSLYVDPTEFSETDDLLLTEVVYPIEFNGEIVEKLTSFVKKRARVEEFALKRKLAGKLINALPDIQKILHQLLELDFMTGLGRFFSYYGLNRPVVLQEPGIVVFSAKNIFLQDPTGVGGVQDVEPIDYNVGGGTGGRQCLNLLTGSNSGGKTTCLLTLAQIAILGQMGFLVPGHVQFFPFEEIYFFEKSSGQLSAGAFEATLLKFVSLAMSEKLKIILADELEAITEPSAAARVIGGILSLLLQNPGNYGVFVTHIGDLILSFFDPKLEDRVRVDGIEATGLDENLNLIVNRNPRLNFLAKSTPELILERLAKLSTGAEKDFFEKIRSSF